MSHAITISEAIAEARVFRASWEFRQFDCVLTFEGVHRGFHFYYRDAIGSLIDARSFRRALDHAHNRQQD